jgi:hypothetical protein
MKKTFLSDTIFLPGEKLLHPVPGPLSLEVSSNSMTTYQGGQGKDSSNRAKQSLPGAKILRILPRPNARWDNWESTFERMKLNSFLTLYTTIN